MNITMMSISSRGLVYFPESLQKKLKLKRPGKFSLTLLKDNKLLVKPVKDIFSMVGKLRSPGGKEFDLAEFRNDRDRKYERL